VIGDTRLDRVLKIKNSIKKIKQISDFKSSKTCIVFGSTWDEDHDLILKKINSLKNIKIIIAPHKIDINTINQLTKKLKINYLKLSNYDSSKNSKSNLLIVDSIGLLSTIYSYADIAYVGGGMSTRGLHNTMEPAVFKIPIIIGKNYQNFNEAKDLVKAGGILSVKSTNDFNKKIDLLLSNKKKREELGEINYNYIKLNSGATKKVLNKIKI
jgi:3-deoxy-D-manno-octulosonic-acid transferase